MSKDYTYGRKRNEPKPEGNTILSGAADYMLKPICTNKSAAELSQDVGRIISEASREGYRFANTIQASLGECVLVFSKV